MSGLITHVVAFGAGAICYAAVLAWQITRFEAGGRPYWTQGDMTRSRQGSTVHRTNDHGDVIIEAETETGGDVDGYMRAVSAWEPAEPVHDQQDVTRR
jgi:hypothetical protein